MNFKQKSIYIVVGLLSLVGIFLLGASYGPLILNQSPLGFMPKPIPAGEIPDQVRVVEVLIDNGDRITGYKANTIASEQSVFQALRIVASINNLKLDYDDSSPMGVFIKQIGSEANGQNNKYWQYWVNGSQPMVAANKFILKGGETVLWTFRKSAL